MILLSLPFSCQNFPSISLIIIIICNNNIHNDPLSESIHIDRKEMILVKVSKKKK